MQSAVSQVGLVAPADVIAIEARRATANQSDPGNHNCGAGKQGVGDLVSGNKGLSNRCGVKAFLPNTIHSQTATYKYPGASQINF